MLGFIVNPLMMFPDPLGKGPKTTPAKCKSSLVCIKASGNRGTFRVESTYDNSDTAKRMADDVKKAMEQSKSKSSDLESYDVSNSSATVTLTVVALVNKNKAGLPGFPFGGGIK